MRRVVGWTAWNKKGGDWTECSEKSWEDGGEV